jgi:hypothetical protein
MMQHHKTNNMPEKIREQRLKRDLNTYITLQPNFKIILTVTSDELIDIGQLKFRHKAYFKTIHRENRKLKGYR